MICDCSFCVKRDSCNLAFLIGDVDCPAYRSMEEYSEFYV